MTRDRCYGCDVDYAALAIGEPCPCTPAIKVKPYPLRIVVWRPPGSCVDCGGPLERSRRGRPPIRCMECSPHRKAWAAKPELERVAISLYQARRARDERDVERAIGEALERTRQRQARDADLDPIIRRTIAAVMRRAS